MTQAFAQTLSADTIPQTGAEEEIGQMYRGPIPRMITSCGFMPRSVSMKRRIKVHDAGFRWAPETGTVCGASLDTGPRGCVTVSPVISGTKTAHSLTVRSNARNANDYSDKRAGESERGLRMDALASAIPSVSRSWLAITANAARAGMRRRLKTV